MGLSPLHRELWIVNDGESSSDSISVSASGGFWADDSVLDSMMAYRQAVEDDQCICTPNDLFGRVCIEECGL